MFKLTNILLFGTCSILLLIGCQPIANEANEPIIETGTLTVPQGENASDTAFITATPSISQDVTLTETPHPLPTLLPTATSLPTETTTPLPLPTQTARPTRLPTLSANEASNKVLSLLADNQNPDCLLPCWWGVTPGQTRWQEVEPFLRTFAIKIDTNTLGASVKLPIPEPIAIPDFGYYASFGWGQSNIVNRIAIDSINITGYDVQTMVALYGIPDEVWLTTRSSPREGGVLPFHLIIVYQEQGIGLRYIVTATVSDWIITACFEPGIEEERPDLFPAGPRIYLWKPGEFKDIDEIANIPLEVYYPLAEKTDLTTQTFYEKFTDPNEQPCIDTEVEAWINQ